MSTTVVKSRGPNRDIASNKYQGVSSFNIGKGGVCIEFRRIFLALGFIKVAHSF